ncbi:unnamed protein product, partial [marine sediment metagenome]
IEPQEHSMVIRMRIDGVLRDMVPPARKMQAAVVTRIKILSEMDIAERRLPQDGRFKIKTSGRDIDVRVSVIPTIYGVWFRDVRDNLCRFHSLTSSITIYQVLTSNNCKQPRNERPALPGSALT